MTSFTSYGGVKYQFCCIPMGLQCAYASFSLALSFVLGDYKKLGHKMKCYIDDILIYSKDVPSHLKTLEYILERFSAHNLLVSFTKSKFL